VRAFLQSNLKEEEARVAQRLTAAVERGELPAGYSAADGARLAVDAMLALATRARIGTPRDALNAAAASAAAEVLSQRFS
jgi:hypothetical protein